MVKIFYEEFYMRNRTANFRIPALILVPALVFLASCESPHSVRIKASPTLQIPIPLGKGADNSFIQAYTNVTEIRKRLEGDTKQDKGIGIYEYDASGKKSGTSEPSLMKKFFPEEEENKSPPAQTYLITYPLFDMSLNFDEYINGLTPDASRVPDIEISPQIANASNFLSSSGREIPLDSIKVDLGDMKSLVSDIAFKRDGVSFSIEIDEPETAGVLESAIRVRVPQLKIGGATDAEGSWVKGELNADKTKLVFKGIGIDPDEPLLLLRDESDQQKKESSEKVDVYIKLVNKITAGIYNTELKLDWYSVIVTPSGTENSTGEIEGVNFGSYLESLGDATFEKVPAYLYVSTPNTINNFEVLFGGDNGKSDDIFSLQKEDVIDQNPPAWLDDENTSISEYDFTAIAEGESITYQVNLPEMKLLHDNIDDNDTQKITVNLAILLPMVFKFSGNAYKIYDPKTEKSDNYYPIKFEGLDEFLGSDGDAGDDDKSVMDEIDKQLGEGGLNSLKLELSDIKNNVTSSIYLAVSKDSTISAANLKPEDWGIIEIVSGGRGEIPIKVESLNSIPPIKFLVKAGDDGSGGRLYIQSQPTGESQSSGSEESFSVKISVVADIDLDKSIDL
jgi:hypothetical protein